MKKRAKSLKKKIFFNASVVLAGLGAPRGGSAKILHWAKQKRIEGLISEVILDEVLRHAEVIGQPKKKIEEQLIIIFGQPLSAPKLKKVNAYKKIVIDYGDAHVLASAKEARADFLVTLDKKHLLVLKEKIKEFKIVTPSQLIEKFLSTH